MSNVIKGNFGQRVPKVFIEYSPELTWEDTTYQENAVNLAYLTAAIFSYSKEGRAVDPTGNKLMALGRLHHLLIDSGSDRVGVSPEFLAQLQKDKEIIKNLKGEAV